MEILIDNFIVHIIAEHPKNVAPNENEQEAKK